MNKKTLFVFIVTSVFCSVLLWVPAQTQAKKATAIIGTGDKAGVYYPTGVAIAAIVNRKGDFRFNTESTKGSNDNINACASGKREFGIAQSDRLYKAIKGLDRWAKKGPRKDLRAVFAIYPEYITLTAAVDAQIHSLEDLRGKRVNFSQYKKGSMHRTLVQVLGTAGLRHDKDIRVVYKKMREAPFRLHEGKIDAFFLPIAHPNSITKEATLGTRKVNFVNIQVSENFLNQHPYFIRCKIPVSFYPQAVNEEDVETIGVMATLFTSAKVPDSTVYLVTKSIFENFEEFKSKHPAYQLMTKERMLKGVTAPWHPGALQYFKQAGLMK